MPLVGILRNLSAADLDEILPIYQQAGLTTMEITMNTPGAPAMIRRTLDRYAGSLNIGAGTVCTPADLNEALEAGAQFIVTPIVNPAVIRACVEQGVPVFPGAFSPSEIYRAWALGATMVKVYPAGTLGPDYLKQVKAPLNQIKLLPTGGITRQTMEHYFRAGADGVGMGSPLFLPEYIQARNWPALSVHFQAIVQAIRASRPPDVSVITP